MKTLVPDEEKLNDASPPDGDDDSVDKIRNKLVW